MTGIPDSSPSGASKATQEARAAFDAAHDKFAAAVGEVDAGRFGEGKTINRMVDGVVLEHYPEHAEDIDRFFEPADH